MADKPTSDPRSSGQPRRSSFGQPVPPSSGATRAAQQASVSRTPEPAAQPRPADVLDLAQKAKLEPPVLALLQPRHTPRQALEQLIAAGHLIPAVRFWAWALLRREAVWWACVCLRSVLTEKDPPSEQQPLLAAEKWVASPTEENRRRCEAAAAAVNFGTPAGCCAMAAFWSGGSIAPPKFAVVSPAEHLLPQAVANSIILAAVRQEPEKAEEKHRRFLTLGMEVEEGKNRWKDEPPPFVPGSPLPPMDKR